MKTPSKGHIIALIAVILVFTAIVLILPDRKVERMDANLVVVNDSDTPIGSVGVSASRWDGSLWTTAGMNADESPIVKGDSLSFEVEGFPAGITVYRDVEGREELLTLTLETEPEEDHLWQVTVCDGDEGPDILIDSVRVEAP